MSRLLTADAEESHAVGPDLAWSESRYVDVLDRGLGLAVWLRLGNRPNEGRGEVSTCVRLPDGTTACRFDRPAIDSNRPAAGGQVWSVEQPFRSSRVVFEGQVHLLADGWSLLDPKRALTESRRVPCRIDLRSIGQGLGSVMGADQRHIDRIFLPGQADWHFQHLVRTSGTVVVGDTAWAVDGLGGRDHSWGPRNWHAKRWFRWLTAAVDEDLGFMLTRAVGPTKETRGGFVWADGTFHLVDGFELTSRYAGAPHHELLGADLVARSGNRSWTARATPLTWVPLRNTRTEPDGTQTTLRIVKSPAAWTIDGREGAGMLEYHDILADGMPLGQGAWPPE